MDLKLQRDCGVMLGSFALSKPTGNAEIPKGSAIHCQTSSAVFLLSYSILLLSLCTIKEFVSTRLNQTSEIRSDGANFRSFPYLKVHRPFGAFYNPSAERNIRSEFRSFSISF
ncbi:hypothetical protein AVEN_97416-1 [Araneus ventricosus]|uniref:Uncharacterized protein n=1 Tax=Araneus ventricosus TaxID=182803 RepID=A0A4Y2PB77_ARAVE|nr:hypothetical protein AVEN_97416-1 [Araneus ventricosus]